MCWISHIWLDLAKYYRGLLKLDVYGSLNLVLGCDGKKYLVRCYLGGFHFYLQF
jgi:hypothetical protein